MQNFQRPDRLWGATSKLVLLIAALFALQSCQSAPNQTGGDYSSVPSTAQSSNISYGDAQIIKAQNDHAIKVEVTVEAPVRKLLREDDEGLPHQKFLISLSNGTTILIAHDLKMADHVPIQPGDIVRIHGEYIWNPRGGLIHWTHHTDTPYHEGGWIELNGRRYE